MEQEAQKTRSERLRDYLAQLPRPAVALLAREFERALAEGRDTGTAELVLDQLRKILRAAEESEPPRLDDLQRLVLTPIEPFLVDREAVRPGQIKRSSLAPVWTWLTNTGLKASLGGFMQDFADAAGKSATGEVNQVVRRIQLAAAEAIAAVLSAQSSDRQRGLGRVGAPSVIEDLPAIQVALLQREPLELLRSRLPRIISAFGENQVNSVLAHIRQLPSLQSAAVLPLAISLVMQHMTSPWQITRLAVNVAGSDEENRVAATPFGVAVGMALDDLTVQVEALRSEIRRGRFDESAHGLKSLHDALRDLRTGLDFRADSAWGRQLSAVRAEIANVLTSEIDSVPGRVRRLLRQRPDKDIQAGAKLDVSEADETVALVNFVATCRNYAGELAINEVSLRTFSDLQHHLESATETLVESLRTKDARLRAFRQQQADLAIRFCEVIFGHDYAALMNKAAEVALAGDRKSA